MTPTLIFGLVFIFAASRRSSALKARPQTSLGQRPRTSEEDAIRAAGPAKGSAKELERAFSPKPLRFRVLGRCPDVCTHFSRSFSTSKLGMPMSPESPFRRTWFAGEAGGFQDNSRWLSEERATPPDRWRNGPHPGGMAAPPFPMQRWHSVKCCHPSEVIAFLMVSGQAVGPKIPCKDEKDPNLSSVWGDCSACEGGTGLPHSKTLARLPEFRPSSRLPLNKLGLRFRPVPCVRESPEHWLEACGPH